MLYCFVSTDIKNISNDDPLHIQADYAKKLGQYILCDLESKTFTDADANPIDILEKKVFLRTTCNNASEAVGLITQNGGILLETLSDINKIENWKALSLTERSIISLNREQILNADFNQSSAEFFNENNRVFMKSKKKGFSLTVPSEKVLTQDKELARILLSCNEAQDEELLISKCYNIKKDSLGKKEVRFFIFDGSVHSCSRAVHSVRHNVPKSFLKKAQEIVHIIGNCKNFPSNYVLDLAEFEDETSVFVDLLELNPVSTSLCYINNTIFKEKIEEINHISALLGAGSEYCLDAMKHPERYVVNRGAGENYEYYNPEHYDL